MAEQDFSEIARLSERLEKDPKSRIFVQLADAYRKNDMVDEAIEILNKGLTYHPQYALAHMILGRCYLRKRMYAQAKESFEKTIAFDAQNIVAFRMLAQTCESLKDEAGQIHAYKGILTLDPFDIAAKEKLTLLESQQAKEPLYTLSLAQEYEKQGERAKALSIYENLLFTDPTDLLLQQKVKELKDLSTAEKKEVTPEKIEGLETDTVFKRVEPVQTREPEKPKVPFTLPETKPAPEIIELKPPPAEPAPEEEILSLEELLISTPEEPQAPAVSEEPKTTITGAEPAKPQEPTQPPPPAETELVIERGPQAAAVPPISVPEIKEEKKESPPPPPEEVKPQAPPEPPPQPEVKKDATKEEDFQSFKEWLSGLLK